MTTPGLTSLTQQVQQLTQQVAALTAPQAQVQQPPAAQLMASIQAPTLLSSILQNQQTIAAQKLDTIFQQYQAGIAGISTNLGAIVEYSVEFVEANAPTLSQLALAFATDTSPFKLNTCISLILLVLPPAIEIGRELLASIINTVVKLKNELGLSSGVQNSSGPTAVSTGTQGTPSQLIIASANSTITRSRSKLLTQIFKKGR